MFDYQRVTINLVPPGTPRLDKASIFYRVYLVNADGVSRANLHPWIPNSHVGLSENVV
jgi:hypothetical protein